mmetsp:Transcript_469/g.694  ORF Transcript_469/g.694 Transcript_469/m.694 type:complete len:246 (-) Transcript_469:28-765(-)
MSTHSRRMMCWLQLLGYLKARGKSSSHTLFDVIKHSKTSSADLSLSDSIVEAIIATLTVLESILAPDLRAAVNFALTSSSARALHIVESFGLREESFVKTWTSPVCGVEEGEEDILLGVKDFIAFAIRSLSLQSRISCCFFATLTSSVSRCSLSPPPMPFLPSSWAFMIARASVCSMGTNRVRNVCCFTSSYHASMSTARRRSLFFRAIAAASSLTVFDFASRFSSWLRVERSCATPFLMESAKS